MAHSSGVQRKNLCSGPGVSVAGIFDRAWRRRSYCYEQAFPTWQKLFSTLGIQPIKVGGVYLYSLATNPGVDIEAILHKSRSSFDTQRLITLITAADKYLSEGGSLDSLNILNLVKLNLISQDLVLGPNRDFDSHLSPHPVVNPYLSYGLELQGFRDVRAWGGVSSRWCGSSLADPCRVARFITRPQKN